MASALLVLIFGVLAYEIYTGGFMGGCFPADWQCAGAPYIATLNSIGAQYGLPANLLPAVAYEESAFNPSAVNCASGALGMFQLLPCYYSCAGQSWQRDAATAAQALAGYYSEFGNWQDALAAYNWGPGNLAASSMNYACLPGETQAYVTHIVAAVPAATGTLVA